MVLLTNLAYEEESIVVQPNDKKISIFNRNALLSLVTSYKKDSSPQVIDELIHSIYIQVVTKRSLDIDHGGRINCSPYLIRDLKEKFCLTETVVEKYHKVKENDENEEGKLIIRLPSGRSIESVLIKRMKASKPFYTLCVSSQVGCKMGCKFCDTGRMGFLEHIQSEHIVEQMYHASCLVNIKGIVFMGMGEPLDNFTNITTAIKMMIAMYQLAPSRISVSTVGDAFKIKKLRLVLPDVSLALSLHSAIEHKRIEMIPSSKNLKIKDIIEACDQYNRVMIEYTMLDGINDGDEDVDALIELLSHNKDRFYINLIPYNQTTAGDIANYKVSPDERIRLFYEKLTENGYFCKIRWSTERSRGVKGACGQLHTDTTNDIEDMVSNKKSNKKNTKIKKVEEENEEEEEVEEDVKNNTSEKLDLINLEMKAKEKFLKERNFYFVVLLSLFTLAYLFL